MATLNFAYSRNCENNATGFEYYSRKQFHYVFYFVEYNVLVAGLFFVVSWIGIFPWVFVDVLIILISTIISTRFRQIGDALKRHIVDAESYISLKSTYIKVYAAPTSSIVSNADKAPNLSYSRLIAGV